MQEHIAEYGFKAYRDKDLAQDMIAYREAHPDDFDANMALISIENPDSMYGMTRANRARLENLNKKIGVNDYIKNHEGFIEERGGFSRKNDVYTNDTGARNVAEFIRTHNTITPEEKADAINREIELTNSYNTLKKKHIERQESLSEKVRDIMLDSDIKRSSSNIINRAGGLFGLLKGKTVSAYKNLDESIYRNKEDKLLNNINNVPDNVLYDRFADSIDQAANDGNTLFNFRYY